MHLSFEMRRGVDFEPQFLRMSEKFASKSNDAVPQTFVSFDRQTCCGKKNLGF